MRFEKPNEKQRKFREKVRATGSCISRQNSQIEIHHPAGRTAQQDGIAIGHWFILPLAHHEHKLIDQGATGLEELKMIFSSRSDILVWDLSLHEFEKFLYQRVIDSLDEKPEDEIISAIMGWSR
jgi:hypothetical protein